MVNWNKYRGYAERAAKTYNVPSVVILAIAKNESTNNKNKDGLSILASKYKNYGGIKYSPKYHSQKISLSDITYRNGKPTRVPVYFAKFASIEDSFYDIARIVKIHYKGTTNTEKLKNLSKKYAEDPRYYTNLLASIKKLDKEYKTGTDTPKNPLPIILGVLASLYIANNIK